MLYSLLLILEVLFAIGVIGLVLLQHGRGADAGAAFGSGASATVFGARGSTSFLSRATAVLATLFFINSLTLAYLAAHAPVDESVVDRLATEPLPGVAPTERPPGPPAEAPSPAPPDIPPPADVPQ